jgi:hypothetical protein
VTVAFMPTKTKSLYAYVPVAFVPISTMIFKFIGSSQDHL